MLQVTPGDGAKDYPCEYCRWLLCAWCCSLLFAFQSFWSLAVTVAFFWVFFCTHFIWLPQHLQLVVPEHNQPWGKLIRIVINYEMGSVGSSEWPMKRKHHYVVWILSSTWFKSVWFAPFCVPGWASGSWGWWNIDFWVQKVFFNLFTLQISRFCIHPSLRVEGKV